MGNQTQTQPIRHAGRARVVTLFEPLLAKSLPKVYSVFMTVIAEKLDRKLTAWSPELASEVEYMVEDIIQLADSGSLDILRSRKVEQEVLDILDLDAQPLRG